MYPQRLGLSSFHKLAFPVDLQADHSLHSELHHMAAAEHFVHKYLVTYRYGLCISTNTPTVLHLVLLQLVTD